jgi:flagellar motility protein MotE (MotC chaperone)
MRIAPFQTRIAELEAELEAQRTRLEKPQEKQLQEARAESERLKTLRDKDRETIENLRERIRKDGALKKLSDRVVSFSSDICK